MGVGGEDVGWYVNHKALRIRQYYHLENEDGDTIYKIRERVAPQHRMVIEDGDGEKVAVVRKRGDGTYWCHVDDDRDIFAEGDLRENTVEMSNIGGLNIAKLRPDQEEDLIMAVLIAVQYLVDDEGDDDDDEDS